MRIRVRVLWGEVSDFVRTNACAAGFGRVCWGWGVLGSGSGSVGSCFRALRMIADVFYSVYVLAAPEILNLVEPMSAASWCWDAVFEFRRCSGVAIRD